MGTEFLRVSQSETPIWERAEFPGVSFYGI